MFLRAIRADDIKLLKIHLQKYIKCCCMYFNNPIKITCSAMKRTQTERKREFISARCMFQNEKWKHNILKAIARWCYFISDDSPISIIDDIIFAISCWIHLAYGSFINYDMLMNSFNFLLIKLQFMHFI